MSSERVSRRTFTASAAGIAAGVFATSFRGVSAQDATPISESATPVVTTPPAGFVSTRVRTVQTPAARETANELVQADFIPDVEELEGFQGYVLGDVIEQEDQSLSIVVLESDDVAPAFNSLASNFVESIEESIRTVDTMQWAGDLLITGSPTLGNATPAATPVVEGRNGYVAVRVHTSTPGTDPRDFVPLATSDFLPIISDLPGFEGYLWYPIEGGFVAISLFDSEDSAEESNEAARDWAAEFLTEYTDGDPDVYNANVVYKNLPIFTSQ